MAGKPPGTLVTCTIDGGTTCLAETQPPGTTPSTEFKPHPLYAQQGWGVRSDGDAFKTAIDLFRETPMSKTENGKRVLAKLDESLKALSISYGPENASYKSSGKIQIEESYIGDIEQTSDILVHEAFHLAIPFDLYIDSEVAARDIQAEYSKYLFDNSVRVDGQTYQLKKAHYLLEVKRNDQVVDWIIAMYFGTQSNFTITKEWIMAHKEEWKGLCNRKPETRKIYAKILVDSQPTGSLDPRSIDPNVAAALFELLECAPMDSKMILDHADESDAMVVLGKLPTKYASRYAAWQNNMSFSGPPALKEFQPPSR